MAFRHGGRFFREFMGRGLQSPVHCAPIVGVFLMGEDADCRGILFFYILISSENRY